MAEIPYGAAPNVAPDVRSPGDYLNVQPKAYEATERLGAQMRQTGQFFAMRAISKPVSRPARIPTREDVLPAAVARVLGSGAAR